MERTKHRRSRLWLIPLAALILIFAAAAVLMLKVSVSIIHREPSISQYALGHILYLYGPELMSGPGGQYAGDPLLYGVEPVSDPAVTELVSSGGDETLTGGIMPVKYFCQADELWCDLSYGTDTIGPYGCGPTVMAMAVSSMTGSYINPQEMARRAVELGCWAKGHGSYHSIVSTIAEDFGLVCDSFEGRNADSLINTLVSGKPLIALLGPGHFTDGGHFIMLRGVTLSGDILVADPNSRERSLTAWDPEIILSELSVSTDSGAPLWVLSKP